MKKVNLAGNFADNAKIVLTCMRSGDIIHMSHDMRQARKEVWLLVNVNKLKGKIVERGMNVSELAEQIGIDSATLYRKLSNNGDTILIKEANLIAQVLELSKDEAMSIFFNQIVA
jgi:DNA-binding Xre family transcriptional regulator